MLYQGLVKRETRFTSNRPAKEILSKIEETAAPLGFDVKKNNYKVNIFPYKVDDDKFGKRNASCGGHDGYQFRLFSLSKSLIIIFYALKFDFHPKFCLPSIS